MRQSTLLLPISVDSLPRMASSEKQQEVRKRRVFYIPGYDPFHPRRYRELYRTESAAQGAISGYSVAVSARAGGEGYGWNVTAEMDGQSVAAQVDVLTWSDIVRDSMSSGITQTYLQLIRTAWTYITSGALRRLMRLRKGPVIAALYPVGMLLGQLLLAILFGWLSSALIRSGLGLIPFLPELVLRLVGLAVFLGVVSMTLRWFKSKDNKLYAYYLMHDYAFAARWGGANPPALETRMATFGDRIADALEEDVEEVLVVGHSSGAHLAVSVLADLIRAGRVPEKGVRLSFLSLGQVVPMMSFLPKADKLRADLHFLSTQENITWVDVTAPGDGCAFALCDPVAVSGVGPENKIWPLVFSAAFTKSLSLARWKALRWRFFRLHFQYLCAFDRPRDYDYFQITAGPLTLGTRYADRPPSVSRIDIPVSPHTSMAA